MRKMGIKFQVYLIDGPIELGELLLEFASLFEVASRLRRPKVVLQPPLAVAEVSQVIIHRRQDHIASGVS
jgi:hypothetical protein